MNIRNALVILAVILAVTFTARYADQVVGIRVKKGPSVKQAKTKMLLPIGVSMAPSEKTKEEALQPVVPAEVPASLLDFSVVVAGKMKEAKTSFVYAEALFSEFGNCAVQEQNDSQNLALRAYCLANAKKLVAWYPDLSNKWQTLAHQVGRHLLDLVDLSQG